MSTVRSRSAKSKASTTTESDIWSPAGWCAPGAAEARAKEFDRPRVRGDKWTPPGWKDEPERPTKKPRPLRNYVHPRVKATQEEIDLALTQIERLRGELSMLERFITGKWATVSVDRLFREWRGLGDAADDARLVNVADTIREYEMVLEIETKHPEAFVGERPIEERCLAKLELDLGISPRLRGDALKAVRVAIQPRKGGRGKKRGDGDLSRADALSNVFIYLDFDVPERGKKLLERIARARDRL